MSTSAGLARVFSHLALPDANWRGRSPVQQFALGLGLSLFLVLVWLIARPYSGIEHDTRLYGLVALAQLHPDSLGQDVFLKYGGQDNYTLFGPAFAAVLRFTDLETGAMIATYAAHAWWLIALVVLARKLLPPAQAFIAVAVTIAVPLEYGAAGVFRAAEGFLTPRLLAEAATLSALSLAIDRRWIAAFALSAFAMAFHPIMAAPGLLVLLTLLLGTRGPWLLLSAATAGTLAAIAVAHWFPIGPIRTIDPDWLALIANRAWFANADQWPVNDWAVIAGAGLAQWMAATAAQPTRTRMIYAAVLTTGAAGLVVDLLGAGWGEVLLIYQGQGARWVWIGVVMSYLAIAAIWPTASRAGGYARAALLLLVSSLLLDFAVRAAVVGIAAAFWAGRDRLPLGLAKGAMWLAVSVTALAVSVFLLDRISGVGVEQLLWVKAPAVALIAGWMADGALVAVVAAVVWVCVLRWPTLGAAAVCLATLALGADIGRHVHMGRYSAANHERFASWRTVIPTHAEILWADDPPANWFLLNRRSFASTDQAAGIVFSRETAFELLRRSESTRLILPPAAVFGRSRSYSWRATPTTLLRTCRESDVDFVVTKRSVGYAEAAPPVWWVSSLLSEMPQLYRLYNCESVVSDTPT